MKRPAVMSLDDLMGPSVEPEPAAPAAEQQEPVPQSELPPEAVPAEPVEAPDAPAVEPPLTPVKPKVVPPFRTSIYFHREVHDALRDIAYRERKNISDLVNEGLDHVLTSRNYPTTGQLRKGAKAS